MKKILIISMMLSVLSSCNNGKTADCTIDRKEHLTNEEWEIIITNCEYFSKLLEAEEYLKSGGKLSAGMVQPLLPTNEKDFDLFRILELYPEDDCNHVNLYWLAAQYATDDSLDVIEHVLMWPIWTNEWELPWELAIEIEKKNSEKLYSTIKKIWNTKDIEYWQRYRCKYYEFYSYPENQYDQFVYGK